MGGKAESATKLSRAFRRLERRAEAGDSSAQVEIAVILAIGDGVEKDSARALCWYEQAAKGGEPNAAFNAAAMLWSGEAGNRDTGRALYWMKFASEAGSGDASVWLGEMCLGKKKLTKATEYFCLAVVQQDIRGLRGLSEVLSLCEEGGVNAISKTIKKVISRAGVSV